MSLGLVGLTQPNSQLDLDVRNHLRLWVGVAIDLRQSLQARDTNDSASLVRVAIDRACSDRTLTHAERSIALALGVFCWCDRSDIQAVWRETLSLDLDPDTRHGIRIFSVVLQSFLLEPPGHTTWLPLKRKTTIAALNAFSPEACVEVQQVRMALMRDREIFRSATAIACQLPWHTSACRLAKRHVEAEEICRLIGTLLGAAFGTGAFQEERVRPRRSGDEALAYELAPLWMACTGSHTATAKISASPILAE